jgi:hypothetical protein
MPSHGLSADSILRLVSQDFPREIFEIFWSADPSRLVVDGSLKNRDKDLRSCIKHDPFAGPKEREQRESGVYVRVYCA